MQKELILNFGALGGTIKEQLKEQGFKINKYAINFEKLEKLRDSINMLYLHGYISESEKEKKFQKLFNAIKKQIKIEVE